MRTEGLLMTSLIDRPAAQFGSASNLVCRECGTHLRARPVARLRDVLRPARDRLRPRPAAPGHPRVDRGRPGRRCGATHGLLPVAPLVDLEVGHDPAGAAPQPRPRARACARCWVKDDSGNPTHSFKDRVVAVAASAARALGYEVLCLRLDRQPRERRRRGRGQRRPALGRASSRMTSRPARSSRPRCTAGRWSRSKVPTTTSTGCAPRSPASCRGRSSTSTCGRSTPRVRRPSATRSPSSSAGGCPSRS